MVLRDNGKRRSTSAILAHTRRATIRRIRSTQHAARTRPTTAATPGHVLGTPRGYILPAQSPASKRHAPMPHIYPVWCQAYPAPRPGQHQRHPAPGGDNSRQLPACPLSYGTADNSLAKTGKCHPPAHRRRRSRSTIRTRETESHGTRDDPKPSAPGTLRYAMRCTAPTRRQPVDSDILTPVRIGPEPNDNLEQHSPTVCHTPEPGTHATMARPSHPERPHHHA